jgi:Family of unknown function (DUF5825)
VNTFRTRAEPAALEAAAMEAARLRGLMTAGVIEPWAALLPEGLDTRSLHHLPPPAGPGQEMTDPGVKLWGSAFRPGLCYYRRGPGFITVSDYRAPESAARLTISQEPLIDAFLRCEEPVPLTGQAEAERSVLEILLRAELLLRFGDFVTTAPYHMRRWPIPAQLA